MKWYKHDPDAFISGTTELRLDEVGAYILLIDLLYSRDGNVPDNDAFMARALRCHPSTWRRVKATLLAKGKIRVTGGKLGANRVESELSDAAVRIEKMTELGRKSAEKRKQNNETRQRPRSTDAFVTTTTREEELSSRESSSSSFLGETRARPPVEKPAAQAARPLARSGVASLAPAPAASSPPSLDKPPPADGRAPHLVLPPSAFGRGQGMSLDQGNDHRSAPTPKPEHSHPIQNIEEMLATAYRKAEPQPKTKRGPFT